MFLDDLTGCARALKLAECARAPMADLPCPILYLYDHAGNLHGRLLAHTRGTDTGTVTALIRATLPDPSYAYAAIVADCHIQFRTWDDVLEGNVPTVGDLERDYAENPATTVRPALVVFGVSAHGHREATVIPYRWGDTGLPEYDDPMPMTGGTLAGPLTEVAAALVGVQ